MPRGGHFAALEEPELIGDDLRNFIPKMQAFEAKQEEKRLRLESYKLPDLEYDD